MRFLVAASSIFCVILCLAQAASAKSQHQTKHEKCLRITHEMCNDLPYNMTSFPNLVNEETMKDASESIATYKPLLSVVCSEQLKFFLCSVYFPMCNEKLAQPIGPCRPLCLSVKEKCLPILQGFGFTWPDVIRCDKFPLENNREKMCMKGPNEQGTIEKEERAGRYLEDGSSREVVDYNSFLLKSHGICPNGEVFINKTAKCVPLCGNNAIAQNERESATKLLLFLASSSIILTFLSIFIVFISKFGALGSQTEISMFFASIAFAVSSLIYVFSVSFREQISCTDYTNHLLFIVGGMYHAPCSSIASLIYYFSTAARIWWFMVCFSWNRQVRFNDVASRIQMLVWGLPLAPLMLALLAKSISANPLTGICLVGTANSYVDWVFNFSRDLIFFVLSTISIFSSCCRLFGQSSAFESSLEINGFAGLIGAIFPISSLFYILSFINESSSQSNQQNWSRTFNTISAIKYNFDLILSLIMCALCFVYLLSRVARSPSKVSKEGYQPAIPKIPTPAIPGSVRSNTYASTFRNQTNLI
ncbi:unnamed protein product [Caenorhabditis angaria]|uniref:Frizzled-4 n=1 Tax=Caenorhabditis angaria TaxID=860376 RepID=A0A9P1MWB6_9PELO|nr:unnamed protein product [Caenorhabditis angaria]